MVALSAAAAVFLPDHARTPFHPVTSTTASPPVPPGPETTDPEAALKEFNENFAALLEARKAKLLDPGDDAATATTLESEVGRLEAKDQELRALIDKLSDADK